MKGRWIVFLLPLAPVLLLQPPAARAQGPARVQVRLILASNQPGFSGASAGLGDIAGDLRSLFNYRGYRLLSSTTATLFPGRPANVGLAYGTTLEMYAAERGAGLFLAVRWLHPSRGPIVSTQVRLRGRNPVLIGGPTVRDGTLIVALSPG